MRVNTRRLKALTAVTSLVLAAGGLAACGGSGGSDSKTVTIWMSVDQPVFDGLKKTMTAKAKKQGITVKLSKVTDINSLIMTKIQANDAPDIALIPQPGVVANIVKRNKAIPLDGVVDTKALKANMLPGSLDAGTFNGKLYGVLASANVKSLVFYNKKAFDAKGYKAPQSIDELNQLTDQIKSDGGVPWCFGIESDTATGWPATDWFEDLIMKYGGAQTYNDWVTHKVKFDSDVVRKAAEEFQRLVLTKGNTIGGGKSIASTNFGDAENTMWKSKPGCWMEKQGTFITAFWPPDVVKNFSQDVGVFGFPPATAGEKAPVLGGGDIAVLLNDSDAAKKAMKMLSETDNGVDAAKNGSTYLSPHSDFDSSLYVNPVIKEADKVVKAGSALLFDGSDQMPGEVGAGSFWKQVTAWITGQQDLDQTLKAIDDSWPSS